MPKKQTTMSEHIIHRGEIVSIVYNCGEQNQ